MKPAWGWVVALIGMALAGGGCNSSGYQLLEGPYRSIESYDAVEVAEFDFGDPVWDRNRDLTIYAVECADIFNARLLQELDADRAFQASRGDGGGRGGTLVIRCAFTIFRPVRHALNFTVGYGAGRAAMEVTVEFADAASGEVLAAGIVRAVQGRGVNALWYNTGRMLVDCAGLTRDMLYDAAQRPVVAPAVR